VYARILKVSEHQQSNGESSEAVIDTPHNECLGFHLLKLVQILSGRWRSLVDPDGILANDRFVALPDCSVGHKLRIIDEHLPKLPHLFDTATIGPVIVGNNLGALERHRTEQALVDLRTADDH
jgi:hypothetical protein